MSEPGAPGYQIGDVVNGYVLTDAGWQPVSAGQPGQAAVPTSAAEQPHQYRVGDQANGYVLTDTGWQPLPGGQPAPGYQPGDVVGGYVLTEGGWQLLPGAQSFPAPAAAPGQGEGAGVDIGTAYGGASGPYGPVPTKRSNKTLYWILAGAAVVLLVVVAGVAVAVRTASNGPSSSSGSTATSRATSSARSSATAQTFAFGDTGTVADRWMASGEVKIDAPVPFQPTNRFDTPDKGQFMYVPVSIAATGTGTLLVSSLDFVAILPDGQRIRSSLSVDVPSGAPAQLPSSTLNSGEKVVGSVAFDVPANTAVKVAYAPSGQVLGTWG